VGFTGVDSITFSGGQLTPFAIIARRKKIPRQVLVERRNDAVSAIDPGFFVKDPGHTLEAVILSPFLHLPAGIFL
jgi:hypothetical protein